MDPSSWQLPQVHPGETSVRGFWVLRCRRNLVAEGLSWSPDEEEAFVSVVGVATEEQVHTLDVAAGLVAVLVHIGLAAKRVEAPKLSVVVPHNRDPQADFVVKESLRNCLGQVLLEEACARYRSWWRTWYVCGHRAAGRHVEAAWRRRSWYETGPKAQRQICSRRRHLAGSYRTNVRLHFHIAPAGAAAYGLVDSLTSSYASRRRWGGR